MQASAADRSEQQPADAPRSPRDLALPALGVFALFLAFSLIRMPVPSPGEPYYLPKAKHYWDAAYSPGDLFLDSADTHLVFYQTVGWLTRFLTLEETAVVGRIVSLALLAAGWTAFASRLIPARWGGLWSASLFLAIAAVGNFSGEWIVGGFEAKVFSYAFVFFGLAALHCGAGVPPAQRSRDGCTTILNWRWILAGLCGGLAISFHPVVGVWALLAAAFAGMAGLLARRMRRRPWEGEAPAEPESRGPGWKTVVAATAALVAASLPGLIPALEVVRSAPAGVQHQADFILVFYRLKHHLDPMDFSPLQYAGYAALLCFWIVASFYRQPTAVRSDPIHRVSAASRRPDRMNAVTTNRPDRMNAVTTNQSTNRDWFRWFVLGAVLAAVAGLAIGVRFGAPEEMAYLTVRMKLMKFYPFRLADVMLPIACALPLAGFAARASRGGWVRWLLFAAATAFALAWPPPAAEANPSRMEPARRADWIAACEWIRQNTPNDAHFLTPGHGPPGHSWAFKWHAHRAEFVTFKDCPQDAPGIVEWNRRLLYYDDWRRRHFDNEYSAAALDELQQETAVTHLLALREVNMPIVPIYSNGHYSVYRLP